MPRTSCCQTQAVPTRGEREGSDADRPEEPFNPAISAWVSVKGTDFWFEPLLAEFKSDAPGRVVVLLSDDPTKDRSVEVDFKDDGLVVLWLPDYCRVFWCPKDRPEGSWVSRLQEIEYP